MAISTLLLVNMRLISALLLSVLLTPLAFAGTGRVEVLAVGAPGEILLDSFPTGKTAPATLEGVAVGEHEIKLVYGCMTGSGRVLVQEDKLAQANLQLNNAGGMGTARIRELPTDAEIWVDDALVKFVDGISELPCGAHRMLVEAPGYLPWQETIVVTTGKWTQLRPKLERRQVDEPSQAEERVYDENDYVDDEFDSVSDEFQFADADEENETDYIDEFENRQRDSDYAPRTPEELSGLDGPAWRSRSFNRASLTKRVGLSTTMALGGVVGLIVAVKAGAENNLLVEEYTNLYRTEPHSEEAQEHWREYIRPVRIRAGLGGAGAVLGLGGATAVMFFLDVNDTTIRLGAGGRF